MNYYEILGLSHGASNQEIKKAYHKLAIKWHPDKNNDPGAAEKFRQISEAYQYLTSPPSNKNEYNEYNEAYKENFMSPEELFESFFTPLGNPLEDDFGGFFRFFSHSARMSGPNKQYMFSPSVQSYSSSVSSVIKNGRKIETRTESRNGAQTQTRTVTDLRTNHVIEQYTDQKRIK